MDDLWGNAWSDPPPQPTKAAESPKPTAWSVPEAPAATSDERHEVPSLSLNGLGSLPTWGSTNSTADDTGLSWGVSTLNIAPGSPLWGPKPLGSPKLDAWRMDEDGEEEPSVPQEATETTEEEEIPAPEERNEPSSEPGADATPIVVAPVIAEPPPPEPVQEPSAPLPLPASILQTEAAPSFRDPPGSPDGFGGFESGHTVSAWSPPSNTFRAASFAAEDAGWGGGESHWGPSAASASPALEPPEDEWGAARETRSRGETRVSQADLDTALAEWSELSLVLFPSNADKREDDDETLEGGLEQVPGFVDYMARVAPSDPQLPPPSHIPSTSIHKQMATAIKLTRHIPISNLSPLNQLFASKGSTAAAWEHAVRTHVVNVSDDWSWMGGKPKEVLEAEEKEKEKEKRDSVVVEKKGLLASLWGRSSAAATPTPSPATEKPATEAGSNVKPVTPEPPAKVSSEAPLPSPMIGSVFSSDARRSSDTGSIISQSGVRTSTPSLVSVSSTAATSSNSSIEITSPTTATQPTTTTSSITTAAPVPQSAVSRFLGRFSRSRTPTNSQFGHSVSLSDADLSFLEEVPTVGEDDGDDQMKAFEDLLGTSSSSMGPAVLTKRPVSMVSGRMAVPIDSPPRLGPPPKGPKSVGASPATPAVGGGANAGGNGQEKEEDDIWAVFEKPAASTRKSALPVMGRPGSMQFGSSVPSRPGGITTPIARMTTKHSTGPSTASLPPILAPPPRLSAPPSRSSTPLPPSPAGAGSAFPTIPPPNPPPLITPSIIARRATNASSSSPLTTSSPSFPPPKAAASTSAFDDFGDFLDSAPTASSTATATPSDPLFSLASPLAPVSSTSSRISLSPIITRPTPASATSNGFGSFGAPGGDDGFGDFMSPVQQQPTPPATQFALGPLPKATLTPNNINALTLGIPSPRITAPDTPLYPPDPNKPLPPPRSLSPLLKKVATTQSDKWPKPDHAPVGGNKSLPPALAPPPGGSGFRKPQAPAQDLLAMGSPLPQAETKQGGGSVFAMMQAQTPSPVVDSGGPSFTFPPPPGGRQVPPSLPPTNPTLPTFSSPPPPVPALRPASVVNGTSASGKGGLSAADLSFFEGL